MLHYGSRDSHHICFLKRVFTNQVTLYLAGDHHQRDGIHISSSNTGNGIGCTRPGRDQHHTGLPRRAGIAVGCMGRGLLMANQNMRYFLRLEQGVVDVKRRSTGVSEDVLDALVFQSADDHISAR